MCVQYRSGQHLISIFKWVALRWPPLKIAKGHLALSRLPVRFRWTSTAKFLSLRGESWPEIGSDLVTWQPFYVPVCFRF